MKITLKKILMLICVIALIAAVVPSAMNTSAYTTWDVIKTNYGVTKPEVATSIKNKGKDGVLVTAEPYLIASAASVLPQTGNVNAGKMEYVFDVTVDGGSLSGTTTHIFLGLTGGNYITDGGWNNIRIIGCGLGFDIDVVNEKIGFYMPRSTNNDTSAYFPIQNSWGKIVGEAKNFSLNEKHRITIKQNNGWKNGGRLMIVAVDGITLAEFALLESGTNNPDTVTYSDAWLFYGFNQNFYVATNDYGNDTVDNGERAKLIIDLDPNGEHLKDEEDDEPEVIIGDNTGEGIKSEWTVVPTEKGDLDPDRIIVDSEYIGTDGTKLTVQSYNTAFPQAKLENIGSANDGSMQYEFDINVASENLNADNVFVLASSDNIAPKGTKTMMSVTRGFGFKIDTQNQKISFYLPRLSKSNNDENWLKNNNWGEQIGKTLDFTLDKKHKIILKQVGWKTATGMSYAGRKMYVYLDDDVLAEFALYEGGETNADNYLFYAFEHTISVATEDKLDNGLNDGEKAIVTVDLTTDNYANAYLNRMITSCQELADKTEGVQEPKIGQVSFAAKEEFQKEIDYAKTVSKKENVLFNEMKKLNKAKNVFENAIVKPTDKDYLQSTIRFAKEVLETLDSKSADYAKLSELINEANAVVENEFATQDEVNDIEERIGELANSLAPENTDYGDDEPSDENDIILDDSEDTDFSEEDEYEYVYEYEYYYDYGDVDTETPKQNVKKVPKRKLVKVRNAVDEDYTVLIICISAGTFVLIAGAVTFVIIKVKKRKKINN